MPASRPVRSRRSRRGTPSTPSTPSASPFPSAHQKALWVEVVRYHAKAVEYLGRHETLGSYYNVRLAVVACEHLALATGHTLPPHDRDTAASSNTVATDVRLNPHKLLATLSALRDTLPTYVRRVKTFQRAFGCQESGSGSPPTTRAAPDAAPDADCAQVQAVDLRADTHPVLFDDLVGNDLAKDTLEDTLIRPVLCPHLYPNRARALLFYGPPGTGKTLLARACAFELNRRRDDLRVLFFAPTGDEFKGKYVGETEEKIVRLFRCASQKATALEHELQAQDAREHAHRTRVLSVLFIDEIDSLARRRDGKHGTSTVTNATNTLLQTMDGIRSYANVVVIGATNYPWNIDSAVLRRFGQKVYVPLPTEDDLFALMRKSLVTHLKRALLGTHASEVSRATPRPDLHRVRHAFLERTDEDLFHRWGVFHGIREEDIRTLVSEMTTTTKRAGFAPRDVVRMCELAYKREAKRANQSIRGFSKVVLRPERSDHPDHTENSERLLRLVEGLHVSAATFARLKAHFPHALDTSVRAEYADDSTFPTRLTLELGQRRVPYTEWSHIHASAHPVAAGVHVDGSVREHYHVYLATDPAHHETLPTLSTSPSGTRRGGGVASAAVATRVPFVLYRSFRVATQRQTHTVPVCLCGAVAAGSYTLDALLQQVTIVRYLYDDSVYQTDLVDESGEPTGAHLRLKTLTSSAEKLSLSVVDEQEGQWMEWVRRHLRATATGSTSTDTPDTAAALINRLWVKGTQSRGTQRDHVGVDVTDRVRIGFGSARSTDPTHHASRPAPIQCVHLTYEMQTFLDARHAVPASARVKNIQDLDMYQRTQKEPE